MQRWKIMIIIAIVVKMKMTIKPPPQQCKNEEMGFTLHHRVELVERRGHQFLPRIASTAGK